MIKDYIDNSFTLLGVNGGEKQSIVIGSEDDDEIEFDQQQKQQQQQQNKNNNSDGIVERFQWLETIASVLPNIKLCVALKAVNNFKDIDTIIQNLLIDETNTSDNSTPILNSAVIVTNNNSNSNIHNQHYDDDDHDNDDYYHNSNFMITEEIPNIVDLPFISTPRTTTTTTTTTTITTFNNKNNSNDSDNDNFIDEEQKRIDEEQKQILELLNKEMEEERLQAERIKNQNEQSMKYILSLFKEEKDLQQIGVNENEQSNNYIQELLEREQREIDKKRREDEEMNERMLKMVLEEEKRRKQEELENKTYLCEICFSDCKIEEIYILEECHHRFCKECMGMHFKTNIENGNVKDIRCPNLQCKRMVTYQEIKHNVSKAILSKYEDFLLKISLKEDANCRFCPRPGCSNAMIGDSTIPMMVCSSELCKYAFCFNCRDEWHADSTCENYQQWKKDNNATNSLFISWANKNTKDCPKCKSKIEKNGGCNHMKCIECKHQFCWLCLGDYISAHWSTSKCKQYS